MRSQVTVLLRLTHHRHRLHRRRRLFLRAHAASADLKRLVARLQQQVLNRVPHVLTPRADARIVGARQWQQGRACRLGLGKNIHWRLSRECCDPCAGLCTRRRSSSTSRRIGVGESSSVHSGHSSAVCTRVAALASRVKRPHNEDRVCALAEADEEIAQMRVRDEPRARQPRVAVEPEACERSKREPVRGRVAEEAGLVVRRRRHVHHHRHVLPINQVKSARRQRRLQHLDRKVARVGVHVVGEAARRRADETVAARPGRVGSGQQLRLASIQPRGNLRQISGAVVRALQKVVQCMHPAQRGQLSLVVHVRDAAALAHAARARERGLRRALHRHVCPTTCIHTASRACRCPRCQRSLDIGFSSG
eukprot:3277436-Pleurochrysis_carterae.AAC.2